MYCSRCGKEIPGDARYCPGCGSRQEMGVVPADRIHQKELSDPEKLKTAHRRGRRLGNFLVTVTALLILFAMDGKVPNAGDYVSRQMDASRFVAQNRREMVICNAEGETCTADLPRQVLYSADHSRIAYVDQDQELYYMDDMTPVFLDDRITAAEFSFYGETLAWLKEADGGGQELCICMIGSRSGTVRRITVRGCSAFCLSPDGRTAACVEADGSTLSVWRAGEKETRIAGNVSEIISVSDKGTAVVYRKGSRLYLSRGGEETELASVEGTVDYVLNETQTELLYTDEGSAWYYSTDQEEPVRLTGVKGAVSAACHLEGTAYQQRRGLILGKRTLKNMLFVTRDRRDCSYRIYRLDGNGKEAGAVLNHADQFQIAEDERSLLYLADHKLYRIEDVRFRQEKTCLSDPYLVDQFAADEKLSRIWFATPERELCYLDKNGIVSLSKDLSRISGRYMNGILFQENRELYYADGDDRILVKDAVDGVSILENGPAILDTDGRYCYMRDLKNMVDLIESR